MIGSICNVRQRMPACLSTWRARRHPCTYTCNTTTTTEQHHLPSSRQNRMPNAPAVIKKMTQALADVQKCTLTPVRRPPIQKRQHHTRPSPITSNGPPPAAAAKRCKKITTCLPFPTLPPITDQPGRCTNTANTKRCTKKKKIDSKMSDIRWTDHTLPRHSMPSKR